MVHRVGRYRSAVGCRICLPRLWRRRGRIGARHWAGAISCCRERVNARTYAAFSTPIWAHNVRKSGTILGMRTASSALKRSRRHRFEKLVDRILNQIDPAVRQALDNVSFVVEESPSDGDPEQFGVYDGVPKSERGGGYTFVVPDRIVVFQKPLVEAFPDQRDLEEQVRITLLHEIGHHLGLDEDELDQLGLT
jgi:predicted Zn-dependent protease with MMP-like domain